VEEGKEWRELSWRRGKRRTRELGFDGDKREQVDGWRRRLEAHLEREEEKGVKER
jgi:hypothetical protein